jgi:hypothetical protein
MNATCRHKKAPTLIGAVAAPARWEELEVIRVPNLADRKAERLAGRRSEVHTRRGQVELTADSAEVTQRPSMNSSDAGVIFAAKGATSRRGELTAIGDIFAPRYAGIPPVITIEYAWKFLPYPIKEQSSLKTKLKLAAIWVRKLTTNAIKSFGKPKNAPFQDFTISIQ